MATTWDFTSERVLGAHIGFLRLMVEAMAPSALAARSQPLDIAAETAAVCYAVETILCAAAPSTRRAVGVVVERIRPACCGADAALARSVEAVQRRLVNPPKAPRLQARKGDSRVQVFALWQVVAALVTTGASEHRLFTARSAAQHALTVLGEEADPTAQLAVQAQLDFYDTCLAVFAPNGAQSAVSLH